MRPRAILVPTDFGESAERALRYAEELAETFDAALHVLYVTEYPLAGGAELCREKRRVGLERLRGLLGSFDETRVTLACRVGTPIIEIVEYVKAHGIDLVVMGTHPRLPTHQMATSSVTENIVRQIPCPIVVVPAPVHELAAVA
jgi:nucleotide-binding universal stress UspA family protein